jgi:transposase-like protein
MHKLNDLSLSVATSLLEKARWPDKPTCVFCKSTRVSKLNDLRFKCKDCHTYFSVTTQTFLHKTHLSIDKWLIAIYLTVIEDDSISIRNLAQIIDVNKNTAQRIFCQIEKSFSDYTDRNLVFQLLENIRIYLEED